MTISRADQYIENSHADNTKEAYERDAEVWYETCDAHGLDPSLPASEDTVVHYIALLAEAGAMPGTLQRRIAGLRTLHREHGVEPPSMVKVRQVIRGYRRERADKGLPNVKHTTPMLLDDVRAACARLVFGDVRGSWSKALLLMAFSTGMRVSELAALRHGDVRFVPRGMVITVRKSKTDQDAKGHQRAVPYGTDHATCPVRAAKVYIGVMVKYRGEEWVAPGTPFFPRLFPRGEWEPLPHRDLREFQRTIENMLVDKNDPRTWEFTAHSLRAGMATASFAGGARELDIARHGGWADGSSVLRTYIHAVEMWQENPAGKMGL